MSAYVIFDVEIRDVSKYQEFMKGVKPALDAAGARYLARGARTRSTKEIGNQDESWCLSFHRSLHGRSSTKGRFIRG